MRHEEEEGWIKLPPCYEVAGLSQLYLDGGAGSVRGLPVELLAIEVHLKKRANNEDHHRDTSAEAPGNVSHPSSLCRVVGVMAACSGDLPAQCRTRPPP